MGPRISVVIPTFQRAASLERLLRALERQDLGREAFEVVVVCDGAQESAEAMLDGWVAADRLPLRVLRQANAGAAAARHAGIRLARGARVALIDDDMEVGPEFLSQHLLAAQPDPERTVVLGRILPVATSGRKPLVQVIQEADIDKAHEAMARGEQRPCWLKFFTGNVSVPRDLYLAVGGFDPQFTLSHDIELGYRLERGGARFVFSAAAASVHHTGLLDPAKWTRLQIRYGEAAVRLWRKHGLGADTHPLRFLVEAGPLKQLGVWMLVPLDALAALAVVLGGALSGLLFRLGLTGPAIAGCRFVRVVQFFRGVRRALGSGQAMRRLARDYAAGARVGSLLPTQPTPA